MAVSVFLLIHLFLSDSIGLLSWRTLSTKVLNLSSVREITGQSAFLIGWDSGIWAPNFQRKYISRALIGCRISLIVRRTHIRLLGDRWNVSWQRMIYLSRQLNMAFWVPSFWGSACTFYCTTCSLVDLRINSNKKFCLSLFPLFHC